MEKFLLLKREDVAISGISGRFPRSRNVKEFASNLYNKVDMIDDDERRWKHFHPDVPRKFGKIGDLEKFDAAFFSILDKNAATTDPQGRMLLEHSYEAILDAGICPQSLIGSRTGVYVASMANDSLDHYIHYHPTKEGQAMYGNTNFYLANRISYALGLCGPSITLDTACSGSAYALDLAFNSITSGRIDAAIVAGTNLILNQNFTIEMKKAGVLSGKCESRPFDENAAGYVRAEAICAIFLQKRKEAKRVYAKVVHTSTNNDGFKPEGSSYPSSAMQRQLMEEFYDEVKVDPATINFVEAHSTGTPAGDPQEVNAVDEVFCKNRRRNMPLLIGSVKSNIGHTEASAGVSSIAKILIAFENRKIPPNINLTTARASIEALAAGRMKVVTEPEQLEGGYIAMNSFGLGGANAHVLFEGISKEKINRGIPSDNLSRLVLWSGRTEEAVEAIFTDIVQRPLDAEHLALLQNSQTQTSPSNNCRGFGIFSHDQQADRAVCINKEIQVFYGAKPKIVWVYSGMGSQWNGMVSDLMAIPTFAASIDRSHQILLPKGLKLKEIIASSDEKVFDNVLNSYVGIIAIEIALTDVLRSLGLEPDFIIGHSVGELGCAYADGCFTAEETILAAYLRGVAGVQSKTIKGAMAAIGLGHMKVKTMLPNDIDIACHNGSESTTISGPVESVSAFVEKLSHENIFAKEVASSGVAFHSRYITEMGEKLMVELKTVIKDPKKRSTKWLSSTFPSTCWNEEAAQYSSAEYHTKNLLNSVLFEEVCKMLPSNALTVEIGPHGLFKSILMKALKDGASVNLMRRGEKNGSNFLMNTLGKLFQNGVDMDIANLYPTIEFPVSRGTPMISPILKWDHEENHFVSYLNSFDHYGKRNMIINLSDKSFEFMSGHVADNRVLFPASGWIYHVWETFAMMIGVPLEKLKVIMGNVKFLRATPLIENFDIKVTIAIHRGTGRFEVCEDDSAICEGFIKAVDEVKLLEISTEVIEDGQIVLNEDEHVKITHLRKGYVYRGAFQGLKASRANGTRGKIMWKSNWIAFMDVMIQNTINREIRSHVVPTSIRRVIIDPELHFELLKTSGEDALLDIARCLHTRVSRAGGIQLENVVKTKLNKRRTRPALLESYRFVPFFPNQTFTKSNAITIQLQLILENAPNKNFLAVELDPHDGEELFCSTIVDSMAKRPAIVAEIILISNWTYRNMNGVQVVAKELKSFRKVNLIVRANCLEDFEFLEYAKPVLSQDGFIISQQTADVTFDHPNYDLVSKLIVDGKFYCLIQKKRAASVATKVIKITENIGEWLEPMKAGLESGPIIAFGNDVTSGIVGLVNCIRKEPLGGELKCFFVKDKTAPPFDADSSFYRSQLEKGLAMNVLQNGAWGSYRFLILPDDRKSHSRTSHCYADCVVKGDLSSLSWFEGFLDVRQKSNLVSISYAAVNLKDNLIVSGQIVAENLCEVNFHSPIGFEFSGTNSSGKRVMGMSLKGSSMATHFDANQTLCWNIPDEWSLRDAATVPLAYFTVYFAYFKAARIEKGNSILVHDGSDDIGQAAIQIAQAYGLEVFSTVRDEKKRNFLIERFPQLKTENIGSSRDSSFESMIQLNTNGKGVDFVLSSLSPELFEASLRCLAFQGIYLDIYIGKRNSIEKSELHLDNSDKHISIKSVIFDHHLTKPADLKFVQSLIEKDLEAKLIQPSESKVFEAGQLEEAFRFAASGEFVGKVLLRMRQSENDLETVAMKVLPKMFCNPRETFIIAGGLGGFGVELADWLVSRNCRNLVLCSRRGVTDGYQAFMINMWKSLGTHVVVCQSDIATKAGCERMIDDAIELGPVGGIFNLAVVLRDKLFENQTVESFKESLKPKADITKLLDEISRFKCPSLKHFVVFSSVSCGRGNAGQSNYGMGNSIMEQIVEHRQQQDLPAKAIQWGAIGDVGLLAAKHLSNRDLEIGGTHPQEISSCFEVLDSLLAADDPIVSSVVIAKKDTAETKADNVIDIILNIMSIKDKTNVPMNQPLFKWGVDSLMIVEIQQILERDFETLIPLQLLRTFTLEDINKQVESKEDVEVHDHDDLEVLLQTFGHDSMLHKDIQKANTVESDTLPPVLIVPGIMGAAAEAYFRMAEKLKYPTYILQLFKTAECTDFDDLIDLIKNDVLQVFPGNSFILIGQSFGSPISLKLAAFLESKGKIGHVVSVDGSPEWSYRLAKIIFANKASDTIESWTLKFFIKVAFINETKKIMKQVFRNESWEMRVKALYEAMQVRFQFSFEYFEKYMLKSTINRTYMLLNFNKTSFPVLQHSKITLLRGLQSHQIDIDEDYCLTKHSLQPLTNLTLDSTHVTIIQNPSIPNIINNLY